MALLYANDKFPLQVVQALHLLGHDVLTTLEAGNANQATPDEKVLAFATQNGRALLTINKRDFTRLHMLSPSHTGVIVCSHDVYVRGQAERIHAAINHQLSLEGQLICIHRPPD